MSRFSRCLILLTLFLAACGGGDNPTGPEGPGGNQGGASNGSFTAEIDGTGWSATIITPAIAQPGGTVSAIGGSNGAYTIAFAWVDQGPGTYVIGQSVGLNANLTAGGSVWVTNSGTGAGRLVVTTRTSSRIAGTFEFTMAAAPGSAATGSRSVTKGTFDVSF